MDGFKFGEQVGHLGFHFSVAGKTEVDGRPVETATEKSRCGPCRDARRKVPAGWKCHKKTIACGCPVPRPGFSMVAPVEFEFDKFRAIVEWQVKGGIRVCPAGDFPQVSPHWSAPWADRRRANAPAFVGSSRTNRVRFAMVVMLGR